jgi:hypothetical protein
MHLKLLLPAEIWVLLINANGYDFVYSAQHHFKAFSVLFLDEKHQKSRAAEKKAKNFPVWLK